jgi:hypothetical protein
MLEEYEYMDHADDACQRQKCKGMRFKKILNGAKEVLRVIPHEQCFFYRLERIFVKAEADEPTMRVLRKEKTARLFHMRLRTGKIAMRLCLPARLR